MFQSTRPRGARPMEDDVTAAYSMFQSTRPRGARPGKRSPERCETRGFNPRARGGRDLHASVSSFGGMRVSIHAPAGDATRYYRVVRLGGQSFNPRARGGRDDMVDMER